MIPNSMSFHAIGKVEKKLIIVGLQFTSKLFGFPKIIKEKMITLLEEVGKMVLSKLCSSELNKYIIFSLEVGF